jgi:hypothetical protein
MIEVEEELETTWETDITLSYNKVAYATVSLSYQVVNCESSSYYGEQWVTEKWQDINVISSEISEYEVYDEDGKKFDTVLTTKESIELKEQATQEFLESELQ